MNTEMIKPLWLRLKCLCTLWILCCGPWLAASAAELVVIDDEGTQIRLEREAARIISLAPSLTEMLFAAGAGDKLVGVVDYSDYPETAKTLPVVGRHDRLDMERILALRPDLIVAWQSGNPRASVNRLRQLGLTVYVAEPRSLDSIPSHIERLATLAGSSDAAAQAIGDFQQRLSDLRTAYSESDTVLTFYQVWDDPLITAGGDELINDIIELCGGSNVFADIDQLAPKVDVEAVLQRNPQVIIASGMDIRRPEWLDDWLRWPSLRAVAAGNLFFVPPELLQRHTPRALDGATQLCGQIDTARRKLPPAIP